MLAFDMLRAYDMSNASLDIAVLLIMSRFQFSLKLNINTKGLILAYWQKYIFIFVYCTLGTFYTHFYRKKNSAQKKN